MKKTSPSKKRAASGNNNNTEQPKKARMSRQSSAGRAKASSGKSPHSTKLELLASKYNLALVNRWVTPRSEYENKDQCGKGTFGCVYRAVHKKTKLQYAIKSFNMKMEFDGFPKTAIQEIMWLKHLQHPNIVALHDIIVDKAKDKNRFRGGIHLVLEFVPFDLQAIMEYMPRLSDNHVKCYLNQLLQAVHFMHSRYVINRDIKPANILITCKNELKLADWGLARKFNPLYHRKREQMTERVVTIWYRAPDLLLGNRSYGLDVDMWSVGCVFGEMLINKVVFPARGNGRNQEPKNYDQLKLIWDTIGGWDEHSWPDHKRLRYWNMVEEQNLKPMPNALRPQVRKNRGDDSALDLLDKMLCPDPKQRISAKDATLHSYFWGDTLPKWQPTDLTEISEEAIEQMKRRKTEKNASRRAKQQRQRDRARQRVRMQLAPNARHHGGAPRHHGGPPRHGGGPPRHGGGGGAMVQQIQHKQQEAKDELSKFA